MVDERIQDVFREVFRDDDLEVVEATSKADIPGWDSLTDVKLVIAIEEEFQTRFTTQEVGHVRTVGDFVEALARRGIRVR